MERRKNMGAEKKEYGGMEIRKMEGKKKDMDRKKTNRRRKKNEDGKKKKREDRIKASHYICIY